MAGSVSGLISGLKTDEIIAKMIEFGRRPVQILEGKQTTYTAQLTAWMDVNTRLLALRMSAGGLSNSFNFKDKTATSSDEAALTVTAGIDAAPGTYTVRVDRLAAAEQRLSQGYADTDKAIIGTGTITVGVGDAAEAITIDSTNNTLAGLRDAINRAGVGVTAGIVDFGSGTAHDYHLQVTSNATGAANAITWSATLAGGIAPTWTTSTAAQDAQITVGPAGNTTTITKSGNTVQEVYPGLTLNLKAADSGKAVTITVAPNTSAVTDKIKAFVGQYNSVIDAINKQFTFNADSGTSGALFGDFALQNIQTDLRDKVLAAVPGLPSSMSALTQIGISSDSSDRLLFDEAAFSKALATDPAGVMKLFTTTGDTSDVSISYLGSGDATKSTDGTGYRVRIDQVATQARVTAGAAQTAALAADETLTLNGIAIKLTAGMTGQQVLDAINKVSDKTGVSASRTAADGTGSGDYLTLTRAAYGAAYKITAVSTVSSAGGTSTGSSGIGNVAVTETAPAGEGSVGTGAAGQDVKGAFGVTVDGSLVWEEATGAGQTLTGKAGNANTDGLQVRAASTTTGEHGTLTLARGVGGILNNLLGFLTGENGTVTTAQTTLNKQIDDLKADIADQDDRLSRYEEKLRYQFNALESQLGQLQNQSAYLASQFAAMSSK